MSDNLRDRIAVVVQTQLEWDAPHRSLAVADAVIAALGLREEWGALDPLDSGFLTDTKEELKPMPGETMKHRYITEWENDERT